MGLDAPQSWKIPLQNFPLQSTQPQFLINPGWLLNGYFWTSKSWFSKLFQNRKIRSEPNIQQELSNKGRLYIWVEISFFSFSPHLVRSTEPRLARFLILIRRVHKSVSRIFLARCQHGVCYDIIYRPLWNIKLDQHLVLHRASVSWEMLWKTTGT